MTTTACDDQFAPDEDIPTAHNPIMAPDKPSDRWAYYVLVGWSSCGGLSIYSGFLSASSQDEAVGVAFRETEDVIDDGPHDPRKYHVKHIRVWQDTELKHGV